MNMRRIRGVYVVEFAIVGLLLFIVLFGVLEVGRLLFTVNTLNETVRRGARLAAVCDIDDSEILRRAVFAGVDKTASTIIGGLDSGDLVLSYLDADGESTTNFSLIRFVQVTLQGFEMNLLTPVLGGSITLQTFRAVLPRESLGRHAEGEQELDKPDFPGITPC